MANQSTDLTKSNRTYLLSDTFKSQILQALPKDLEIDKFMRLLFVQVQRNPKLLQCSKESIFGAAIQCAQMGLLPDGRQAHLVPFKGVCTPIADWKGLVELMYRTGRILRVHADVICEHDEFEYNLGQVKRHVPNFKQPRGAPYAAYAFAEMAGGTTASVVMTREEIYMIRDKSSGYGAFKKGWAKDTPWEDPQAEPEMWKKTAVKRLAKYVPLSSEIRDMVLTEDSDERFIKPATMASDKTIPEASSMRGMLDDPDLFSGMEEEPETAEAEQQEVPTEGKEPDAAPAEESSPKKGKAKE